MTNNQAVTDINSAESLKKVISAPEKKPMGRPKGSTNDPSRALARKLARDEENSPLGVMVRCMKMFLADAEAVKVPEIGRESEKEIARKAKRDLIREACAIAKDAAPFVHARLQTVSIEGSEDGPPILHGHVVLSREEAMAHIAARGLPMPTIEM